MTPITWDGAWRTEPVSGDLVRHGTVGHCRAVVRVMPPMFGTTWRGGCCYWRSELVLGPDPDSQVVRVGGLSGSVLNAKRGAAVGIAHLVERFAY